ncbi:hypothetical protein SAMN05216229_11516 [Geopseudomonas sagittaria]|uniref:Uncharacterized protein n=1 Tax=Geopseudomonas sagittaria TaxID=1135990 RepID=A0A1I5X3L9_9GAMM|nr:hypothetical protein [Pseudomonas sagittaria]MCM2330629.1 hypothetical protein [Pseudomonas sagittaria]SFQ26612.1 hypothetical protein SAMN05216229_11516 [Pseudomonas sagittaria]
MNAQSKIEQHSPIRTDGFEIVEYRASTTAGIAGSLPYLAYRVLGA